MAVDIPVRKKYRHPGGWPQSQPSSTTPNGGDAFLYKHRTKDKLPKIGKQGYVYQEQHARSMAGMRVLVIEPGGRRRWK